MFAKSLRLLFAAWIASIGASVIDPMADAAAAEPVAKASVIMYHRFGESDYPSTNVTMAQFRAHIAELQDGDYNVIALDELVAAVRDGTPLPPRTVSLSVDDAYESVYTEAWPLLKAAGFPLAIFVATDPVDRGLSRYMSWDQLRELAGEGVIIGSQTKTHPHMADQSADAARNELRVSNARFQDEMGQTPTLFAYPYGEASLETMELVREAGFIAAFGQHSGAIGSGGELFYMPRFAMNENFGSLDRFQLAANAVPLGYSDMTPADPVIGKTNPPNIGFTVDWPTKGLDRLNCFASHTGSATVERLGKRIEVRVTEAMPRGRTRLNCTMPAGDGKWYWFGRQFYVPRQN